MNMLFEFGEKIIVPDRKGLEEYLYALWKDYKYLKAVDWFEQDTEASFQPFISFDGNQARANNFVGFVKHNDFTIEIYPKVFHRMIPVDSALMHRHLFFWFSYCRRIDFPFNQSFLDDFEIESIPELIIHLISRHINETLNTIPYFTYEAVEEALRSPKGSINFSRYTRSVASGRHYLIDCDHEPYIFDNKVNRIIKYCARLLLAQTKVAETQRILNDILFLLDEVEEQAYTPGHIDQMRISAIFREYEEVLRSCRMILENHVYSHAEYEMRTWSLLFPMEYVFEDFIYGFLKDHFSDDFDIEPQKSDLYLHQDPPTFNLQHDILVTNKKTKEKVIIDTKYKPRWDLRTSDKKKGVSQTDMYQMISYAYRRGVDRVIMIYPNTSKALAEDFVFRISGRSEEQDIKIKVVDVPFWSENGHEDVRKELFIKLNAVIHSNF